MTAVFACALLLALCAAVFLPGVKANALEPATPATALTFTDQPEDKTNETHLTWSWFLAVDESDTATYSGFEYSLTASDGEIIDTGLLDKDTANYSFNVPSDTPIATYTFALQAVSDDPAQTPLSLTSTIEVNTVPPVIIDEGVDWQGNKATPELTVKPAPIMPETEVPEVPETPAPTTPTESITPVLTTPTTPTPPAPKPAPTFTYHWTTRAPASLATISDTSVLRPVITFHSDGVATFTMCVTDEYGNQAMHSLILSYMNPAVTPPVGGSGSASGSTSSDQTPRRNTTSRIVLARAQPTPQTQQPVVEGDNTAEIIAKVKSSSTNEASVDAPANTAPITEASVVPQSWALFGIAWYWWVLVIGSLGSALLWYTRVYHREER